MTELLREAIAATATLPPEAQNALAREMLERIEARAALVVGTPANAALRQLADTDVLDYERARRCRMASLPPG